MSLDYIISLRYTSSLFRVLSHLIFWVIQFSSSYYLILISIDQYKDTPLSYLTPLRNTIGVALVFYVLMYFVIPKFLIKKKVIPLIITLFFLIYIYVFIEALGEKITFYLCESCSLMAEQHNPNYISVIRKSILDNILFKASNFGVYFNLFSSLLLPIAVKSSLGYYTISIKNLNLEKEKVELELNFLKAQVNPHFLFNTLNNLYGLIIKKNTDNSAETVTRLSNYMRYSLSNANKKNITLSEELELIKNYIELEKLRLNHTQIQYTDSIINGNKNIPPLLFIPLIENAFKYNVDEINTAIIIDIKQTNTEFIFTIQNSFNLKSNNTNGIGLGISNLKKRLDLYFSKRYTYNVDINDNVYTVLLKLNL